MQPKILTISILLVLAGAPLALADETKADCEPVQPWVGYNSTRPAKSAYESYGRPGGASACEGEHWDGQDSVYPEEEPGGEAPCARSRVDDLDGLHVSLCRGADPSPPADPFDALTPVAFRVSEKNGGAVYQEAYVALDVWLVGQLVVYGGRCADGASGLEGDESCDGAQQARGGVYVRDNTPGNLLANAVNSFGITRGYVAESDCTQETYERTIDETGRPMCGRDNTALTGELLV